MTARLLCSVVALSVAARAGAADPVTFEKDVRPIFKAMCFHCHGEEDKPKGKLDLRLVRLMTAGGTSGAGLVPGKPGESLIWERIESDEMPEGPKKLTAAQKAVVKAWIEQGAKTARPEPADIAAAKYSAEELGHWAFQPVTAKPADTKAIDRMLLARLTAAGVPGFSPEADKRTLIRRLAFDLTGLPPTPAEVEAFVADQSPTAYEKLIDRLLASPHYGERWGRHWLDVAGYAETDGNQGGLDKPRPHAWKYRDYVIASFNADKPYDRFVREQLAGDEFAARPLIPADPKTAELLTATGFLRMAPDTTEVTDTLIDRNQAAADTLKVVSTAILGLTVGCAQCHDHRYDPISHEDYHRLRAVFDPAFDLARWQKPSARTADATTPEGKKAAAELAANLRTREAGLDFQKQLVAEHYFEKELEKVPAGERVAAREAVTTPAKKQTKAQQELLGKYPKLKPVSAIKAFIEYYDPPLHQEFEKEQDAIAKDRLEKLPRATDRRMIPAEQPGYAGKSRLFHRGDPDQPKQAVTPGDLFVVARLRPDKTIPEKDPTLDTTGRRKRLAEILTDGTHPLTARVMVNRVWLHHFGRGLVNTPGDFGLNGDRPSHPELLDALAAGFVADGWSVKRLHKRILMTQAFRQRSVRTPQLDKLDPDNKLVGRQAVRRLEAEAVRDALLLVAGKLNPAVGGPSVPVTEDTLGRGVLGTRELSIFGKPYGPLEPVSDADAGRRSVYVTAHRQMPLAMLDTFDLPAMLPNCDARKCSTVPPQSLMFLNDTAVVAHADALAERLFRDANSPEGRVDRAFALLFAAEPTAAERAACLKFLDEQAAHFRTTGTKAWLANVKKWPHAPDLRATSALCQTLFAANRFLYVD